MVRSEIWAVSRERISDFFLSQDDVYRNGDDCFLYKECEIRLAVRPERVLGRLSFPATQVDFRGPDPDSEEIYRRFFLRFISAGA